MNRDAYLEHLRIIELLYSDFICELAFSYSGDGLPAIWPGWIERIHRQLELLAKNPLVDNAQIQVCFRPSQTGGALELEPSSEKKDARPESFENNWRKVERRIEITNRRLQRTCAYCTDSALLDDESEPPRCERHKNLRIKNLVGNNFWDAVKAHETIPSKEVLQEQVRQILKCCDVVRHEKEFTENARGISWNINMAVDQPMIKKPDLPAFEEMAEAVSTVCQSEGLGWAWKSDYSLLEKRLSLAWDVGVDTLPGYLSALAEEGVNLFSVRTAMFVVMLAAERNTDLDLKPMSTVLFHLLAERANGRLTVSDLSDRIKTELISRIQNRESTAVGADSEIEGSNHHGI